MRAERRGAAKLTHRDDEGVIEHATFAQITHQRGDDMIEHGKQRSQAVPDAAVGRDVVAVIVPGATRAVIAEVNGDKR
jgi:hypothetical protein